MQLLHFINIKNTDVQTCDSYIPPWVWVWAGFLGKALCSAQQASEKSTNDILSGNAV